MCIDSKTLSKIAAEAKRNSEIQSKTVKREVKREKIKKALTLAEKIIKELPQKARDAASLGESEVLIIKYCSLKLKYLKNQPEDLYIPALAMRFMTKHLRKMEKEGHKFELRQEGSSSANYSLYLCWLI